MGDTTITLRGRVGTQLYAQKTGSGQMSIRFRLAVTNWFATSTGELAQARTNWYTIRAWDRLAENALASVHKGEPVLVMGRPTANAWVDKDGEQHSEVVITAQSIGHDLANGRTQYERIHRLPASASEGSGVELSGEASPHAAPEGGAAALVDEDSCDAAHEKAAAALAS